MTTRARTATRPPLPSTNRPVTAPSSTIGSAAQTGSSRSTPASRAHLVPRYGMMLVSSAYRCAAGSFSRCMASTSSRGMPAMPPGSVTAASPATLPPTIIAGPKLPPTIPNRSRTTVEAPARPAAMAAISPDRPAPTTATS